MVITELHRDGDSTGFLTLGGGDEYPRGSMQFTQFSFCFVAGESGGVSSNALFPKVCDGVLDFSVQTGSGSCSSLLLGLGMS